MSISPFREDRLTERRVPARVEGSCCAIYPFVSVGSGLPPRYLATQDGDILGHSESHAKTAARSFLAKGIRRRPRSMRESINSKRSALTCLARSLTRAGVKAIARVA